MMKRRAIAFGVLLAMFASGCEQAVEVQLPAQNADQIEASDANAEQAEPGDVLDTATSSPMEKDAIVFGDRFPEVLAVKVTPIDDASWRFNVTLSSTYDNPERYADAWRVLDGDGEELGIRVLGHDHAGEQPFTRSHTIQIPDTLDTVFVEGRDQANGWSGQRFEVNLPAQP